MTSKGSGARAFAVCTHAVWKSKKGPTKDQTSSPTGWLRMLVWRMSLPRMISAIISWAGSFILSGILFEWIPRATQPHSSVQCCYKCDWLGMHYPKGYIYCAGWIISPGPRAPGEVGKSSNGMKLNLTRINTRLYGPRQANLVLIAYASSEGSDEPAHPCSLARTSTAHSYKQWVKRNRQTESQTPGPSEWLGMHS